MKYLCLAYGDEEAWNALPKDEQQRLLAQDDVLRKRGDLVAAVESKAMTVSAWDGTPIATDRTFADSRLPLAGFCIVEARDVNEVIQLIAETPCARAKGVVEVRPIGQNNDADRSARRRRPTSDRGGKPRRVRLEPEGGPHDPQAQHG